MGQTDERSEHHRATKQSEKKRDKRRQSTTMTTGPKHRSPWQRVDVQLGGDKGTDDNHYDEAAKLKGRADVDLEAHPGENMAMFLGLEVIRGDQYRVETKGDGSTKFMVFKEVIEASEGIEGVSQPVGADNSGGPRDRAKQKRKNKRKVRNACEMVWQTDKDANAEVAGDLRIDKGSTRSTKLAPESAVELVSSDPVDIVEFDRVAEMQTAWSVQTGGVILHESICRILVQQDFWQPTPIQSATLPASILGRRNIVGAAPTGSGKTLAYLLPIVQHLLEAKHQYPTEGHVPLQALILAPTRELALQIYGVCDTLMRNSIGAIVGGFAHAKQQRVLDKNRPPVLVGTPGRLWELMHGGQHSHLVDLSQVRYLVIDEADRMIQQGSFPQLSHIFDAIHRANPMDDDTSDDEDSESAASELPDRLLGLPGVPGEARVQMLDDSILQRSGQFSEEILLAEPETIEVDDEEFANLEALGNEEEDAISLPDVPPVHRQTLVFSATLTLPMPTPIPASKSPKHRSRADGVKVEGAIQKILEASQARGQTKVVDLSNTKKDEKSTPVPAIGVPSFLRGKLERHFRLPPGLRLQVIKCTQLHKDSHLYAYLTTTAEGTAGPCLVFCNSVAGVRRVGATLQHLGIDARVLHAQMQQRARLKTVEALRRPDCRTVVVATDVAARGLDIGGVTTIIHYDMARNVDTFVHRSGRTARGMGAEAIGTSLSLVAPGEDKNFARAVMQLDLSFKAVEMDGRLLRVAQERASLAAKIVEADETEGKSQRQNKWFVEQAKEAELELDDDLLDGGLAAGDKRDRSKLREAQDARRKLRNLLCQSMQTQRYGKFLSTNSAANLSKVTVATEWPMFEKLPKAKRHRR